MKTPVYDFVYNYAKSGAVRMHMPGHKGRGPLGLETRDITEVAGADSLYEAEGILAESEKNAAALFGTGQTFYSTEGSSQCIRAMLFLALLRWKEQHPEEAGKGARPVVAAGRNAHKAFVMAAALLDLEIVWLWPEAENIGKDAEKKEKGDYTLCCCPVSKKGLLRVLAELKVPVMAVYLTSPDYLGGILDLAALSQAAHQYDTLLLVDNAHGAYLHFLEQPMHPMDLGADLCCDSAHKTLPVLTGGAYLHIAETAPEGIAAYARQALALFGSTSPSYLILQSLDLANRSLAQGYRKRLAQCLEKIGNLREELGAAGWLFAGKEPMKLTVAAAKCGYYGGELAELLRAEGIECEYADPDFVVFMITPENGEEDYSRLCSCMKKIPVKEALCRRPPAFYPPRRALSVREAVFAPYQMIPSEEAAGRVMGPAAFHCPPAVPVVVSGEVIAQDAVKALLYYGIDEVGVVSGKKIEKNT